MAFCTGNIVSLGIESSKMADVPTDCEFPVWGLLPKKETGVVSFLTKYPKYDGRDTIIAIFDSGVDPAAAGLQLTSTGETKVIERFDCSGCGDVDTSTVKKLTDGYITGLTGRKLKIPEDWKNPSGTWHVGVLYPYSLYPTKLKERVQEHRKRYLWDIGHKPAVAEATKQLANFENDVVAKSSPLSPEDKAQKEEVEARLEILQNAEKKFTDVGPTYDCVLFHDGTVWRACIDTSESGDLLSGPLLAEYSLTHQHTHLTALDQMTISINVHDDGDVLEVVGMCSTHGTHVASIASGYFPEEPEKNGVAPGAKIISLTIGDSRLGSMETGTALVRACIKIMELSKKMKVDVINMSYGEHAHWNNTGRVGAIMCEVVNRYGVHWVVSAGNHGPALCTVGAPPDLEQELLIGVGAYVSPEMMVSAYSMRNKQPGGAYSWSSRGPQSDGARGVSLCAPGGAIAAVARFTLKNCQLMNGTSMAAPHVAGAVAALMSGLKDKELPCSPYSMKRTLENSATYLTHVEPWAQGSGLLNIEKAFEMLSTYHNAPERDVTFAIQCGNDNAKGILLRPKLDDVPKDISITVEPQFLQSHEDMEDRLVIPRQIEFGMRLVLTCPASWVAAPAFLDLMNSSRALAVRVDTSALTPGPHYTSINAYDVNCVDKGPVFYIPITVFQPEPLKMIAGSPSISEEKVLFKPAAIVRHFVIVPPEATWGVLKMSTSAAGGGGRFLVHALQLVPRRSCRSHEAHKLLSVTPGGAATLPFQLQGGVMLEIAIAKYWAHMGEIEVSYSVEFRGVRAVDAGRVVLGAGEARRLAVCALRPEDLQPSAALRAADMPARPSESRICSLGPRDVLPPARQIYQLLNTYTFHVGKTTEVSPIITLLCDMLYESEFESQMWMLYNSCKQLMGVGDAYPSKYSVKLEKGDYTLRLNVRHDNKALLEKLQDMPIIIQQKLSSPLNLDIYCSLSNALTGGKKYTTGTLQSGTILPLYITGLPADKINRSNLSIGYTLSGTVTFPKDELARKVDTYPLQYIVCEHPKRPNNNKDKEKTKPYEDYMEAVKEFHTSWLPKLEGAKLDEAYEEMLEKFPGYLGAHVAYLNAIDPPTDPKKLPHTNDKINGSVSTAWCEQVITIADKVIKQIDQEKLLAYLGTKNDTRTDATKIKQEFERQKEWLLAALARKGTALCRMKSSAAKTAVYDVMRITDITDQKVIHYGVWHYFTQEQWGKAIKLLNKIQEDRPSKEIEERLHEAYTQLGWKHMAYFSQSSMPIKYPSGYRPF